MTEYPGVAYVMPVLNEADYLDEAVASILAQDYEGDKELVLALGPSTDETNLVAQRLAAQDSRITLVDNPQGRTPIALNLAIRNSTNPIVIRVDAHSELPASYTKQGIETLNRVGAHDVGGLMDARGRTALQRAIAAAYHSKFGFGGPAYHSGAPEGEAESAYLGIFRREVFEEVGYFDENMWRAQDWELCLRIRQAGHKVWFDPELKVGYYPRDNFPSLIKQSFASGTWRGEIARRFPEGKSLRHDLPPLLLAGISAGIASAVIQPLAGERLPKSVNILLTLSKSIPVLYGACTLLAGFRAKGEGLKEKLLTAATFPAIHLPWAAGYIKGRAMGAGSTLDKGRIK
ncbi:glycosyl transferase family 2 [Arthrobacter sp. MYb224]|uniref:glycosyltransferase family 2 protein n=1 Tax=unclassified Arthrobacter TaxID=235627 RepID=UPI000CFB8194|nr:MULTISPECIES: glycosyltransferase family 2 protein [unclassified Arthrobacter]PQZ96741.1 glycosyl transferase family 2 [Arthrobacter sp. MYb224]PRA06957.1 glycosyl transferase family 2 [Arthrobacter sp. MYb229]PRB47905.1 glycosyl transferase family 2 [Arthrobacter sp. MYb216]